MSKWEIFKIGDVCDVIAGQSPKGEFYNSEGLGLPFYQGKKEFGKKFISSPQTWTTSVTKVAIAGDILMSIRAPVGPVNFATQKICIGRGLAAIRARESIDKNFLFYYLFSNQDNIKGNEGAVFASINKSQIQNISLPVPPIEEQKRIVEILDKAFEGIAQAEANTRQSLINIRNFFKRYLDKSIHKNNSNWDRVKFQDILSQQPRNGWSPPAENHSDIGVPVLTLSSVTGFHFNIQKIKFTNAPVKVGAHYWLNNGEFLMTRSNTSELVGHVAICENITEPTICCDLIMKMSINPQWAETKFIYWYFRTSKLRHLISNSAQGANPTMKKINKAIVQNFPVFIPPIVEQKKIVEQIEECYQKTQKLETIYQRKLEAIAELKQSILEKAFTSQLSQ
ncbi:restriction endonuclease subunit S [Microcystis aeruginosa CS-338/01]|uniref:restriction endonuclease subunit S n=1 Tax=Microcystis aeruginosa TaxID=1126 RepID=UPI00232FB14F|nr:restriction endonuclease subunit S [Microcystis aeruginosa]MDB9505588.1 restriction endonuclease subunit S [Microcystis aeruginosa CS-338/01]